MPHFYIENQPVINTLAEISQKTGISIGGVSPHECSSGNISLKGNYNAESALQEALKDTNCDFHKLDHRTYVLFIKSDNIKPQNDSQDVIVVFGQRAQNQSQIANSIQVVSGKNLKDYSSGLGDIARLNSGFMVTNLGSGRDKILLRGLSDGVLTGYAKSISGLYFGNSPITLNAPDPDLLLTDIKAVEIFNGPQGALYGEGSVAGVVRIVPNLAQIGENYSKLSVGSGITIDGGTSARFEALNNTGFKGDKVALRSVLYYDYQAGFIDDIGIHKNNINSSKRFGIRNNFAIIPDESLNINIGFTMQNIDNGNSQYYDPNVGKFRRNLQIAEKHDNDFSLASIDIDKKLGFGTFKINANHVHHALDTIYDATNIKSFMPIAPNQGISYKDAQLIDLSNIEIDFISRDEGKIRYLAGVYLQNSEEILKPQLYNNQVYWHEHRVQDSSDIAAIGQIKYIPNTKLDLSIAFRNSQTKQKIKSEVYGNAAYGLSDFSLNQSNSSHHLSSQFSVNYHPFKTINIYAQFGEGYRNGGYNSAFLLPPDNNDTKFDSDELTNKEFGIKYNDAKSSLSVARYELQWDNVISNQLQDNGLPITKNIGNALIEGVEISGKTKIKNTYNLSFSADLNSSKLIGKDNKIIDADSMPNIPNISYNFEISRNFKWYMFDAYWAADYLYRGKSQANFHLSDNNFMGEYSSLDMRLGLMKDKYKILLKGENLLNSSKNTLSFGNPFYGANQYFITPQHPTTISLSISKDF